MDFSAERPRAVLAFDTANEVIALGLGVLDEATQTVHCLASKRIPAHRSSNTRLLPEIDALLTAEKMERADIATVCCGRGPGSFTGVRICIATAKGIAQALGVPLIGVSTLDAIAWQMHEAGIRGQALVLADAMRKEVYPVRFTLDDAGVHRLEPDTVVKAQEEARRLAEAAVLLADSTDLSAEAAASSVRSADLSSDSVEAATLSATVPDSSTEEVVSPASPTDSSVRGAQLIIAGDALSKYADLFAPCGTFAPEEVWTCAGSGLLAALQAAWRRGDANPFDARRHDPAFLLPVYTRLSDAEENERMRDGAKAQTPRNLHTGVQPASASSHVEAGEDGDIDKGVQSVSFRPATIADVPTLAGVDSQLMSDDTWSESSIRDDVARRDRTWWVACDETSNALVAYAGGWVVEGQLQILKIACEPAYRRRGIARELLAHLASDARDLGACECTLEVRASNGVAQSFYRTVGLAEVGRRVHYYRDREDALIMTGSLPLSVHDVAGMDLFVGQASPADSSHPLILAIESSCDETAAAIVDGHGHIVADVVASQIDFHARFGGVVPEIASRKHVEAICGVVQACLDEAAEHLGMANLSWNSLDAVAVTYAPGLVGALVVGVAYAKAAAWAAGIPFIKVNHLEGHLYANKLACSDIKPPLVVSLVSGGHTMLVHVRDWGDYRVMGSTIDDAVGEAFDKVAKALGLGYPGGPVISRLAQQGNPAAIHFPRAMMHSGDLRFSLSGLKTAVVTYIHNQQQQGADLNVPDVAASFQAAVIDVQVAKATAALDETGAKEFCLGGGVAANPALRAAYESACAQRGVRLTMPPARACTDNAAMIALVALDRYQTGKTSGLDTDAAAHSNLEEPY